MPIRCSARPPFPPSDGTLLAAASLSGDAQLRAGAAANPGVGGPTLILLAEDAEPQVRQAAASNPACPHWLIARLTADSAPQVRHTAASNPNCPPELLSSAPGRELQHRRVAGQGSSPIVSMNSACALQDRWV